MLSTNDYIINMIISIIMIVGCYQFYFFPQKKPIRRPAVFNSRIDNKIPFFPSWIWIYSGLYYPIIVLTVLSIDTFQQFNYTAFNFVVLLFFQLLFFLAWPVSTPEEWRDYDERKNIHTRFLALVHKFDATSNSFPSMHVSVAMLCALHLHANLSPAYGDVTLISFLFPVLIAISTLYTKQHYWFDLPAGAGLGTLVYQLY